MITFIIVFQPIFLNKLIINKLKGMRVAFFL